MNKARRRKVRERARAESNALMNDFRNALMGLPTVHEYDISVEDYDPDDRPEPLHGEPTDDIPF